MNKPTTSDQFRDPEVIHHLLRDVHGTCVIAVLALHSNYARTLGGERAS